MEKNNKNIAPMELKKEVYGIVGKAWGYLKDDILIASSIEGYDDPRWVKIAERYEKLPETAPGHLKFFASDIGQVFCYLLEAQWRKEQEGGENDTGYV